jgi:hypothetical protein
LIEKSVAEKVGQKITVEKSRQKNCDRKIIAAGKVWEKSDKKSQQKKCGRKIIVEKVQQKHRGNNMVGVYL